ncbi:TIGR00267 family protein [Halogranum gelatinilyticum]|uniref:TIGR00267 family protein n=1 Tax=Halogranum gelatinilyticum TaxID=660521 RepID=A0A1G9QCY5_9EURY|nr:VIT1/CCC1 transporter family protein [Halogranum gelatinilyticum]SDM08760.1 TIGR00267 family protein [Halogranum gelatinilyticum]
MVRSLPTAVRERLAGLRQLLRDEEVRSISRRYFISNGFDGTLTSIGVGVGSYLSGVADGATVFAVGLGAAVGLGTSGVWSVWEIERAETQADILRLERAMLTDLDDTAIQRQKANARLVHAVMSGIGPILGVVLPLVPFLFEGRGLSLAGATVGGILIGVALLFAFGAYLSTISRQRWYVAGLRMGLAGLVVAAVNYLLPG